MSPEHPWGFAAAAGQAGGKGGTAKGKGGDSKMSYEWEEEKSPYGADHLLPQHGGERIWEPFSQDPQCLLGPSFLSILSGLGVGWWARAGGKHCSGSSCCLFSETPSAWV